MDHWSNLYPNDFAVSGASSALSALIKSILNKTYLLHYGAEFLPIIEMIPTMKDLDTSWALKVEDESSDTSSVSDEEHSFVMDPATSHRSSSPSLIPTDSGSTNVSTSQTGFTRERKASLPLTAKALIAAPPMASGSMQDHVYPGQMQLSTKTILRTLQSTSHALHLCDPADIAQEITRIQCQFFLRIEVRPRICLDQGVI